MTPRTLAVSTAKSATNREHSESEMVPAVLTELFVLLEAYGPQWYTEGHRNRVTRALAEIARRKGFTLIQGRAVGSE